MADTVAVMNAGRVEQLGAPTDLYENPQTTFVANFLGTSNLIEAEIDTKNGDDIVLKAGGGKLVLPESRCSAPTTAGGKVLVGIRPEKIALTHADASFIGVSTQYVIDTPVCDEFAVYVQNVERDSRLLPGADVVLHWSPAHTFGLDAAQDIDAGVETVEEEAA